MTKTNFESGLSRWRAGIRPGSARDRTLPSSRAGRWRNRCAPASGKEALNRVCQATIGNDVAYKVKLREGYSTQTGEVVSFRTGTRARLQPRLASSADGPKFPYLPNLFCGFRVPGFCRQRSV